MGFTESGESPGVFPVLSSWDTSRAFRDSNYEDDDSNGDRNLPVVTVSAYNKTGQEDSAIPVEQQRSFIGGVLPSAVADLPCASLGVEGALEKLNAPACTPGSPRYKAWEYFIAENCDLGTVYAHLRYQPHDIDIGKHVMEARKYDEEMRRNLLEKREIDKYAPPRRVWDLRANRVVPWWVASKCTWAISHAWVAEKDREYKMTPINGYEWPVPIPKDADLDRIRIEMLNLGAEYVWLDVLCLRQEGRGEDPHGAISQEDWDYREALRKEEWKVDLPMIGWVYQRVRQVACYLSGLGLPLSFKRDRDFEDEQCWFNRAWTLQETPRDVVITGRTSNFATIKFTTEETRERLGGHLGELNHIQQWTQREVRISYFLSEMKRRKSSKPVDKVTGLVHLLLLEGVPLYDVSQTDEEAWTELINVADGQLRAIFLFLYPKPNGKSWRPSWRQVMMKTLPNTWSISQSLAYVDWTKEDGDSYYGPRMNACRVQGLADELRFSRHGQLSVKNSSGVKYTFGIFADHACPIPDDLYTLLGVVGGSLREARSFWVVGKVEEPEGKFRKVSVVRMEENPNEESLQSLDVYEDTETFLL